MRKIRLTTIANLHCSQLQCRAFSSKNQLTAIGDTFRKITSRDASISATRRDAMRCKKHQAGRGELVYAFPICRRTLNFCSTYATSINASRRTFRSVSRRNAPNARAFNFIVCFGGSRARHSSTTRCDCDWSAPQRDCWRAKTRYSPLLLPTGSQVMKSSLAPFVATSAHRLLSIARVRLHLSRRYNVRDILS